METDPRLVAAEKLPNERHRSLIQEYSTSKRVRSRGEDEDGGKLRGDHARKTPPPQREDERERRRRRERACKGKARKAWNDKTGRCLRAGSTPEHADAGTGLPSAATRARSQSRPLLPCLKGRVRFRSFPPDSEAVILNFENPGVD